MYMSGIDTCHNARGHYVRIPSPQINQSERVFWWLQTSENIRKPLITSISSEEKNPKRAFHACKYQREKVSYSRAEMKE